MDVSAAVSQLFSALSGNPALATQFAEHPYSTTAQVTGTQEDISQKDMSRIVTQLAAQAGGTQLDAGATKDLASALLGQSGGSVHTLASALFGGAAAQASGASEASGAQASNAAIGGFDLSGILGMLTEKPSGADSLAEIAAKSIAGGVASRGLAALFTGALSNVGK